MSSPDGAVDPNRAILLYQLGDFEEALRYANRMLAAGPEVALSWRFQGECRFSLERYGEAIQSFEKAIELGGPGTEEMFLWCALSHYNDGQPDKAKKLLENYIASSSESSELITKAKNALKQFERTAKPWWQFW
jgi:tetratricopeptide (TPR) repeat protein